MYEYIHYLHDMISLARRPGAYQAQDQITSCRLGRTLKEVEFAKIMGRKREWESPEREETETMIGELGNWGIRGQIMYEERERVVGSRKSSSSRNSSSSSSSRSRGRGRGGGGWYWYWYWCVQKTCTNFKNKYDDCPGECSKHRAQRTVVSR